ncbi:MAG TPA: tetratricopeptide repeat protein [Gallionella sp.]|nr:tetratricopeptide repeat protein [Gallionella sp.]
MNKSMQPTQPPSAEMNALIVLYNERRYAEAESRTHTLLAQYPDAGLLWSILGASLQAQGKDALAALQKTAQLMPDDAEAHYNLGFVLGRSGRLAEAEPSYRRALELRPNHADAHNNLGFILQVQGRLPEAAASFRRVLEINPGLVSTWYNLGVVLGKQGLLGEAEGSYLRALEIKPDFAEAHNNLGFIFHKQDRLSEAETRYRKALEIKPDYAEAHNNLGVTLFKLGRFPEAESCYRKALEIRPDYAEAHNNLGTALQNQGQTGSALSSYRRAMELQPQMLQYAISANLLLPVIPDSLASIAEWRDRYQNGIAALKTIRGKLEDPGDKLASPSFYLAYHNADNRPMMEALCGLFRARIPDLTYTAPHVQGWRLSIAEGQRIRVGFLSEYLCEHTIGNLYQGYIRHLDRDRFEVVVIHTKGTRQDAFRRNLDELADQAITLPDGLRNQQQAVAEQKLDVLFYPDIGMAPSTYFLAHARLAPVQATSWGHPDTSGIESMDYFVSATTVEPEDAEMHYTETLIRLDRNPSFYEIPVMPEKLPTRSELGLPDTGVLYGCPQTLFKFHPEFDAVLAAIAEGDPEGRIVLLEGKSSAWTALLKERWRRSYPVLLERVIFLQPMLRDRFMALQNHMDVLLDPIHFGGGNTFYEAMLYGTPVVTWPGRFMRGRIVAGRYRQMGAVNAPIAGNLEDYASLALALGKDTERCRALRAELLDAAGRELFEDMQAVREFESFLSAAVTAAMNGQKLQSGWRPAL